MPSVFLWLHLPVHISKCSHPNPCVFSDISRIQTALHCSHCSQAPDTCHLSFALLPLLPHSPRLPLFFLSSCPSRTARRSLLKCKTRLSDLKPFLESKSQIFTAVEERMKASLWSRKDWLHRKCPTNNTWANRKPCNQPLTQSYVCWDTFSQNVLPGSVILRTLSGAVSISIVWVWI